MLEFKAVWQKKWTLRSQFAQSWSMQAAQAHGFFLTRMLPSVPVLNACLNWLTPNQFHCDLWKSLELLNVWLTRNLLHCWDSMSFNLLSCQHMIGPATCHEKRYQCWFGLFSLELVFTWMLRPSLHLSTSPAWFQACSSISGLGLEKYTVETGHWNRKPPARFGG